MGEVGGELAPRSGGRASGHFGDGRDGTRRDTRSWHLEAICLGYVMYERCVEMSVLMRVVSSM